jgi:hypothetical protein
MGYAHAEEEADATVAVEKPAFTVCCQCIVIFPPLTCVNPM